MILTNRKKHSLEIQNLVVGACSTNTHTLTFDVLHEIDGGKKLQYSFDNVAWFDIGIPTTNPETGIILVRSCGEGNMTVWVREEGTPTNIDSQTYTSPAGTPPYISILDGAMETTVGSCSAGQYSINLQFAYIIASGDLEWDLNGGGYTSFTPDASPATEIITGLTCDGSTGNVLTLRSVDFPATLDTFTFDAPNVACNVQMTGITPLAESGGVHDLDIDFTYNGAMSGDVQFQVDSDDWRDYTPSGSPDSYTYTGITANGQVRTIRIRSKNNPTTCADEIQFTSPFACSLVINSIVVTEIAGEYTLQVDITSADDTMEYSIDGGAYSSAYTTMLNGNKLIEGLTPDGVQHTLTFRVVASPLCLDSDNYIAPAGCSSAPFRENNLLAANLIYTGAGNFGAYQVISGVIDDGGLPRIDNHIITIIKSDSHAQNCPSYKLNSFDGSVGLPANINYNDIDSWYVLKLDVGAAGSLYEYRMTFMVSEANTPIMQDCEVLVYYVQVPDGDAPTAPLYLGDTHNDFVLDIHAKQDTTPLVGVVNYLSFDVDTTDFGTNTDMYYVFRVISTEANTGAFSVTFYIDDIT